MEGSPRHIPRVTSRAAFLVNCLAVAGALVCAGQVLLWSSIGAWPFHDTAAYWVAGAHLRAGLPVYGGSIGGYLAMLYSPPWAVLYAPLSLLPLELVAAVQFGAQVLALRYVAGSWRTAGLVSWLPFVTRELVTGNIDFLMGAAIYACCSGARLSGAAVALFSFAKVSPVLSLAVRPSELRSFALASAGLFLISLPWLHLWPEWIATLLTAGATSADAIPILPRIPLVIVLFAIRRPWAIAAAAGLATPAFYFHSWVLMLPALRLFVDSSEGRDVARRLGEAARHRFPALIPSETPVQAPEAL